MNGDDILGAARQLLQMSPTKHGFMKMAYPTGSTWFNHPFPIQASALAHGPWQDHPSSVDGLPDVFAVHTPGDLLGDKSRRVLSPVDDAKYHQ